ncbi:MAG: vitamin K epoxide reductase family protein [Planctomycetota bacterium]
MNLLRTRLEERRLHRGDGSSDLELAVWQLVLRLRLPVTRDAVRDEIRSHPHFPSLMGARDALEGWGLSTLALRGGIDLLRQAPAPSLAHLAVRGGCFVVVERIEGDRIVYRDPLLGECDEALSTFEAMWSGAFLAIEPPDPAAAEPPHTSETQAPAPEPDRWRRASPAALTLIALGFAAFAWSQGGGSRAGALLLLELLGLALALPLVRHYLRPDAGQPSALCRSGARVDCRKVLESPAATLFGRVPLADVGLVYFAGGFLTLALALLGSLAGSAVPLLGLRSVAAVVGVPLSLYYQWRVLGTWCVLCVAVQAVLLAEALLAAGEVGGLAAVDGAALWLLGLAHAAPAFLWIAVRPRLRSSTETDGLRFELLRLRRHPRVLAALLADQPVSALESLPGDLREGAADAPTEITIVTNPDCRHCAEVHRDAAELLDRFPDRLAVVYRFLCPQPEGLGHRVAARVVDLELARRSAEAAYVLRRWFERPDRRELAAEDDVPSADERVDEALAEVVRWARAHGVDGTPVVFWNGRRLPAPIRLGDLRFLIQSAAHPSR